MQTKRRDVGRKTHHFLRSSRAGATAAEQRSAVAERQLCCRSKRALLRCAEKFHGCIYREKYSGFLINTVYSVLCRGPESGVPQLAIKQICSQPVFISFSSLTLSFSTISDLLFLYLYLSSEGVQLVN